MDPFAVQIILNAIQVKRHRDFLNHASLALVLLVDVCYYECYAPIMSPYYTAEEGKHMFNLSRDQLRPILPRHMSIPKQRSIISDGRNRERALYWINLLGPHTIYGDLARANEVRNLFLIHTAPPTYISSIDCFNTTRS